MVTSMLAFTRKNTLMKVLLLGTAFLAVGFFSPSLASAADVTSSTQLAQTGGLVQCSGTACDFCDLIKTFEAVVSFLVQIAIAIAVIMLAWGGVKLVISRGSNPGALNEAKKQLLNTVIGIVIIAAAFTFIDSLVKFLVGAQLGPWNQISEEKCGAPKGVGEASFEFLLEEHEVQALEEEELQYTEYSNSYQQSFGSGSGGSGFVPAGASSVPTQQAGKLCFANGVCLEAVNVAGQSGYEYPLCGFNITQFVDGSRYGNTRISQYFTLGEIAAMKGGNGYGRYVYVDPQLPPILDALRDRVGSFTITSGYRSPGYNRALGSRSSGVASCSRHMSGLAVDVIPGSGVSQADVARACKALGARFTKSDYAVHTHCDWGHLTGRVQGTARQTGPR